MTAAVDCSHNPPAYFTICLFALAAVALVCWTWRRVRR